MLTEEAAEFAAGGVKRALFFLGVAVVDQRPALVVKDVEEHSLHRHFSEERVFVEVANDLAAQHPEVVDVFANGLSGETRRRQMFQEWPEAGDEIFPPATGLFPTPSRNGAIPPDRGSGGKDRDARQG